MEESVENSSLDDNVMENEIALTDEIKMLDIVDNSNDNNQAMNYAKCRFQPINELVVSERNYVETLKLVAEKYIPLIDDPTVSIPDDLMNKWRITWGNWLQLCAWHSSFFEKMEKFVEDDPDAIAQLFFDSRSKLRTIYSKYCENHRKASVIAEQYRDFFEERRVIIGDKQDVVSHLMQPVQRIMRYQLPMGEIVKWTRRAELPSIYQWERALDLMKEIPKDTQLILEAARIDGSPQSITALGNVRMRGELNIAVTSKQELQQCSFSDLKFNERRVFLFDQMLLITEEVKVKRKDPYVQSTYMFKNAINVNKMKFHPRWKCSMTSNILNPSGVTGNNAVNSSGGSSAGGTNCNESSGGGGDDEHESIFMISDESPGRDKIYIIDPIKQDQREQWVVQLREIQRMQQDFLMALQDPKRFVSKVDNNNNCSTGTPATTSSGGTVASSSAGSVASNALHTLGSLLKTSSDSGSHHHKSARSSHKSSGSTGSGTSNTPGGGGGTQKKKHKWSSQAFIKHLRPKSEKMLVSATSPSSPVISGASSRINPCSAGGIASRKLSGSDVLANSNVGTNDSGQSALHQLLLRNSDEDAMLAVDSAVDLDDADLCDDSISVTTSNNSRTDNGGGSGGTRTHSTNASNAGGGVPGDTGDILNDVETATIKQSTSNTAAGNKPVLRRAWSAFSFRLRRSKREGKIASHCYSKSDELNANNNSSNNNSSSLASTKKSSSSSVSQPQAPKSGNIFHQMLRGKHHHKSPQTQITPVSEKSSPG